MCILVWDNSKQESVIYPAFLIVWMWPGQFLKQYFTACKLALLESVSLSKHSTYRWQCLHTLANNNIFRHYCSVLWWLMAEAGWCERLRFRHLAWEEMSWPDIHLQNIQLPSSYILASIKIYHCAAFTLHIRHYQWYICYYYRTQRMGSGQVITIHCVPIQMWPIINQNCGQFVI